MNKYATFWPRAAALICDGMILAPFTMSSRLFLLWRGEMGLTTYIIGEVFAGLITAAYVMLLTARCGQTLGKMATGVQVMRVDGLPISYKEAIFRYAPYVLIGLVVLGGKFAWLADSPTITSATLRSLPRWISAPDTIWVLASVITLASNPKRRTIHDFLAGTEVILLPSAGKRKAIITTIAVLVCLSPLVFGAVMALRVTQRFQGQIMAADVCNVYFGKLEDFVKAEGRVPVDADEFAKHCGETPESSPVIYVRPVPFKDYQVVIWSKHASPSGLRDGVTLTGFRVSDVMEAGPGRIGVNYDIVPEGLLLTDVSAGTPADKSGIKSGDIITAVDSKPTTGLSRRDAIVLIRGPIGSEIELKISRQGQTAPLVVKVMRHELSP